MSYIKLTNGVPEIYSIGQLRRDNPNTSFPKIVPENVLADYDVYPVVETPQPAFDPVTQTVSQADVPVLEGGQWVRKWTVTARPADEIAAEVRFKRDRLLAESDWTQVADAPVDQTAWATYRQALRDIPQQAGFPENVTWPDEPNG